MKKTISRSFALILSTLMLLALLPASVMAAAAPEIPLTPQQRRYISINGESVFAGGELSEKWNKETRKYEKTIDKYAGQVRYDSPTNTITLINANLTRLGYSTQYREIGNGNDGSNGQVAEGWGLKANDIALNIELVGNNTLQSAIIPSDFEYRSYEEPNLNNLVAFRASGDVNISGAGSLNISNEVSNKAYASGTYISGKLSIHSGNVAVKAYATTALDVEDGIYVANGASLTAEVTGPTKKNYRALEYGADNGLVSGKNVIASGESKADAEPSARLKTYRSGGYYISKDCYVTIQPMAAAIKAKAAKKTIKVGAKFEVIPAARNKTQVLGVCTFKSNKKKVASVDKETGEVTAVSAGKATITIRQANGKTAKCIITVKKK